MGKVQCPFLVGGRVLTKWCALPNAVFALLATQSQSCLPVHPVHSLVVYCLTRSAQQRRAIDDIGQRGFSRANSHQPLSKVFIRAPRLVATTRPLLPSKARTLAAD